MKKYRRAIMPAIALAALFISLFAGCGPSVKQVDLSRANPDTDFFPVLLNSKFGYIDSTGELVIGTNYNDARRFFEGLAAVRQGQRDYGFIDGSGAYVINAQYYAVTDFHDGVAFVLDKDVEQGGLWGAIDANGEMLLDFSLFDVNEFSEGLALVHGSGGYYFIDTDMKDVFGARYPGGMSFSGGYAAMLSTSGEYIFIDKTGKQAFARSFADVFSFSEGVAAVADGSVSVWGYIDTTGEYIIRPKYLMAASAGEGLLPVYLRRSAGFYKFGYVDFEGNEVIPGQFVEARPFSEGLAAVKFNMVPEADWATKRDFKWGFIDKTGKLVVEPLYDEVTDFKDGVSKVTLGGKVMLQKTGYIDTAGEYIYEPSR